MRSLTIVREVGPDTVFLQTLGPIILGRAIAVAMCKVMGWRIQRVIMNRVLRQTGRGSLCRVEEKKKFPMQKNSFVLKQQVPKLIILLIHTGRMLKFCGHCFVLVTITTQ
jgi:hypothetical protein